VRAAQGGAVCLEGAFVVHVARLSAWQHVLAAVYRFEHAPCGERERGWHVGVRAWVGVARSTGETPVCRVREGGG
jgi:hypothetical protein